MQSLLNFILKEDCLENKLENKKRGKEKKQNSFKRKKYKPDYNFKPKINPNSRKMANKPKKSQVEIKKESKSFKVFSKQDADNFYQKRNIIRA